MTTQLQSPATAPKPAPRVPGEVGLWVLIFSDMLIFGSFFVALVLFRGHHTGDFSVGQAHLHQGYGMFNTLVLLTSSLFVVNGVRLARVSSPQAGRCFSIAIAFGVLFAGVKLIEYVSLFQDDHTSGENEFFSYYFVFTAVHLGHVLLGMGALAFAVKFARPTYLGKRRQIGIEGAAIFWHLVDLLWILLFALLYLMR